MSKIAHVGVFVFFLTGIAALSFLIGGMTLNPNFVGFCLSLAISSPFGYLFLGRLIENCLDHDERNGFRNFFRSAFVIGCLIGGFYYTYLFIAEMQEGVLGKYLYGGAVGALIGIFIFAMLRVCFPITILMLWVKFQIDREFQAAPAPRPSSRLSHPQLKNRN